MRRRERRLEARLAPVAPERVEQRGLLTADVRPGAAVDRHLEVEARAEDVRAEVAGGVRLANGRFEPAPGMHELTAQVDEGMATTDRVRRDDRAFDHRV